MSIKEIIAHLLENDADRFVLADAFAAVEPEMAPDATADEYMIALLSYTAGYLK